MRVRPLSSTCTGHVTNVALWFAWTATKPERRRNQKVTCKYITDFTVDFKFTYKIYFSFHLSVEETSLDQHAGPRWFMLVYVVYSWYYLLTYMV